MRLVSLLLGITVRTSTNAKNTREFAKAMARVTYTAPTWSEATSVVVGRGMKLLALIASILTSVKIQKFVQKMVSVRT